MQPGSIALLARDTDARSTDAQGTSPEESFLRELASLIGQHQYEHWFRGKARVTIDDDELTIAVGNSFLLTWMQKQFKAAAMQAAQFAVGPSARVRFDVGAELAAQRQLVRQLADGEAVDGGSNAAEDRMNPVTTSKDPINRVTTSAADPMNRVATKPDRINPVTTSAARVKPGPGRRFADLSDFVAGPSNDLALTAVRQVCTAASPELNPLFIYGQVGTGKTHLLEGIYRQLRRTQSDLQVVFLTSEAFTNYFTQALREHTLPSFRQRFRTVDVLLVDDIDFLDAKRGIQEEFLHTFKQLESHGKQVVVSSDRHPRLLTKLCDELKTRFLSGMVCRLESPDAATREQIVVRKAARLGADFSPEALTYVAERFTNNVRELEGALHCLNTYYRMTGKRVGVSAARQVLADLERDCIRVVRMADIERVVCDLFGLEAQDLKSSKRTRALSQPRMLAMYLARKHTRAAYSEIGQHFGGRNHSTVISAEHKITEWVEQEAPIKVASQTWRTGDVIESLEQQLQAG